MVAILVVLVAIVAEISYRGVIGVSRTRTTGPFDPITAARDLSYTNLMKREAAQNSPSITSAFWQEMQSQTRCRSNLTVKKGSSSAGSVYDSIDFDGTSFSTTNGLRTTLPIQPSDLPRILIFGGSTVFNYEVPDAETVVSQLQRLLPNRSLMNYGVAGATAVERIRKIRSLKSQIKDSDLVVLIYGVNDVGWYQHTQLWFTPIRVLSGFCSIFTVATPIIGPLVRIAYQYLARTVATRTTDAISALALEMGSNFVAVLQPNLFTRRQTTAYEAQLRSSIGTRHQKMVEKAYEQYLSEPAVSSRSLVDTFDHLRESVYLDWCHLSPLGLKILAHRLFEIIRLQTC